MEVKSPRSQTPSQTPSQTRWTRRPPRVGAVVFGLPVISCRLTIADAHCVINNSHKEAKYGSVEKMGKTEEAQALAYRAAKIDAIKR